MQPIRKHVAMRLHAAYEVKCNIFRLITRPGGKGTCTLKFFHLQQDAAQDATNGCAPLRGVSHRYACSTRSVHGRD